ncbi:hypothetical protein G6F32_013893 [Rhizopus arrhizus]|nr:hypothetical protein G6F32_013893 [Rhizopus arrhizus]
MHCRVRHVIAGLARPVFGKVVLHVAQGADQIAGRVNGIDEMGRQPRVARLAAAHGPVGRFARVAGADLHQRGLSDDAE